jgi:TPR repeat protein
MQQSRMVYLAEAYEGGDGVAKNLFEANKWYKALAAAIQMQSSNSNNDGRHHGRLYH